MHKFIDVGRRVSNLTSSCTLAEGTPSSLSFEQWPEVLGGQRLTGAVLDRLTHGCHLLEATGESYRFESAVIGGGEFLF